MRCNETKSFENETEEGKPGVTEVSEGDYDAISFQVLLVAIQGCFGIRMRVGRSINIPSK
jgi:hypothetical protein